MEGRNQKPIISRCGNRRDNAVALKLFQLLKRDRLRRRTYPIRNATRRDVLEYILVLQPEAQARQQRHAVARLFRDRTEEIAKGTFPVNQGLLTWTDLDSLPEPDERYHSGSWYSGCCPSETQSHPR